MTRPSTATVLAWAGTVVRVALAVIFIWSGWSKLRDPNEFLRAVRAYDATPEFLAKAIGYGLPVLELSLAVLLLAGVATRAVAAVASGLFVVFLIGILQAGARGLKLECGCFGGGGTTDQGTTYTLDILRDAGLLWMAVFLAVWPMTKWSVDAYIARHDLVPPPSAKRMRTEAGKRKYNAMLLARRREQRTRSIYLVAGVSVVVVLVTLVGIGVQSKRAAIAGQLTATNASVTTGITVGPASAAAKVVAYEDFQCPVCNNFEQTAGGDLAKLVAGGKAQVQYHPLGFLDSSSSGNEYSSRAANAAVCASDVSVDAFSKFHAYLYGKDPTGTNIQPVEGTAGRTDAQLIGYFKTAVPTATSDQQTAFSSCVTSQEHKAFVLKLTDNASKKNVNSIPTVFVNGKEVKTPATGLIAAINAAQRS